VDAILSWATFDGEDATKADKLPRLLATIDFSSLSKNFLLVMARDKVKTFAPSTVTIRNLFC